VQANLTCSKSYVIFFAWPTIKNQVWTIDRLEQRGMQNCSLRKLSNQEQESAAHHLYKCRFTIRVRSILKNWLGLHDINPSNWQFMPSSSDTVEEAMASLAMSVPCQIWKQRNTLVFRNRSVTSIMLVQKIEMMRWCRVSSP
jgi:hypothetical protein